MGCQSLLLLCLSCSYNLQAWQLLFVMGSHPVAAVTLSPPVITPDAVAHLTQ